MQITMIPADAILYQDFYVSSESYIRKLLLTWDSIKTIIPKEFEPFTKHHDFSATCSPFQFDFELYEKINDAAQSEAVGYFIIPDPDRHLLLDSMFEFLHNVVRTEPLYESLKWPKDSVAKDHWFLHGMIESPLTELLLEYNIAVMLAHPVLPIKAGNLFNEIVGNFVKNRYGFDLIGTEIESDLYDDKLGIEKDRDLLDVSTISISLPDLYVPDLISKISLDEYFLIRRDLSPLRKEYLSEIEDYRSKINGLTDAGEHDKAFQLLCEFYERVNVSFQAYENLTRRVLRRFKVETIQTILSGIKILAKEFPAILSYCDFLQLFFSLFNKNSKEKINTVGFDYLVRLDETAKISALKERFNLFSQ
jgi:hypothetical protein